MSEDDIGDLQGLEVLEQQEKLVVNYQPKSFVYGIAFCCDADAEAEGEGREGDVGQVNR